MPQREMRRW